MKKHIFLLALCCCIFVSAQDKKENAAALRSEKLAVTLGKYPEILVECGSHKLSKKDVIKFIIAEHPDFEDYSYSELADTVERIADEYIYTALLTDFLKKEGFAPSYNATLKYLQDSSKHFPAKLRKLKFKNNAFNTLAADKDRQLSTALLSYLKKKKSAQIAVTDDEVEFFYRINQNIFLRDAEINIAFIAVDIKAPDAEKTIKNAHSLLMQGVPFEKIAKDINARLPEKFFGTQNFPPEIAVYAAKLPIDEPSEILTFPNYYAIIQVSQKERPEYIPLQDAAFFIRTELESRKCGIYLEKLLHKLLEQNPVKRHFKR